MLLAALAAACAEPPSTAEPASDGPETQPLHAARDGAWTQGVERGLELKSLRIEERSEQDGFGASNLEQGLVAMFDAVGVTIKRQSLDPGLLDRLDPSPANRDPVEVATETPEVRWRLARWGADGELLEVESVAPTLDSCPQPDELDVTGACLPDLEYRRDGHVEVWHNGPDGLRQSWLIEELPGGGHQAQELVLEFAVNAPVSSRRPMPTTSARARQW